MTLKAASVTLHLGFQDIMATKYFEVMATDNTPTFEQIAYTYGSWSGVAKVEDDAEIERLVKLGKKEITAEAYETAVKKKAREHNSSENFRQVTAVLNVQPAASRQPDSGVKAAPTPAKEPPKEAVIQPAPVPTPRRRSQAATS
jgi:hypothetical protein